MMNSPLSWSCRNRSRRCVQSEGAIAFSVPQRMESSGSQFDASGVRWDIDVHTYAGHPRVRYYLAYFQGPARSRMDIFLRRSARFEKT